MCDDVIFDQLRFDDRALVQDADVGNTAQHQFALAEGADAAEARRDMVGLLHRDAKGALEALVAPAVQITVEILDRIGLERRADRVCDPCLLLGTCGALGAAASGAATQSNRGHGDREEQRAEGAERQW